MGRVAEGRGGGGGVGDGDGESDEAVVRREEAVVVGEASRDGGVGRAGRADGRSWGGRDGASSARM